MLACTNPRAPVQKTNRISPIAALAHRSYRSYGVGHSSVRCRGAALQSWLVAKERTVAMRIRTYLAVAVIGLAVVLAASRSIRADSPSAGAGSYNMDVPLEYYN